MNKQLLRRALLAATTTALFCAAPGLAFRPSTDLYIANEAIKPILAGGNSIQLANNSYPVPPAVAESIRAYPNHYRGGAIGSDLFPDLLNRIRRDKSGEWLSHIVSAGQKAYNRCGGCPEGRRALAFAYGFLSHAAGEVWSNTLVNRYTGVFPTDFRSTNAVQQAVRHLVIEGYVGRHTPSSVRNTDIPVRFVYDTLVNGETPARLGHGFLVKSFTDLRESLQEARARLVNRIHDLRNQCLAVNPFNGNCSQRGTLPQNVPELLYKQALRGYLDIWVPAITEGLEAYPKLWLDLANSFFISDAPVVTEAYDSLERYGKRYLRGMLGDPSVLVVPQSVRQALARVEQSFIDFLKAQRDRLPPEIRQYVNGDILARVILKIFTGGTVDLDQFDKYVTESERYIADSTARELDAFMGLPADGKMNPVLPFKLENFAAVQNSVTLTQLSLLDGNGLNAVLAGYGVPPRYEGDDNVLLGWVRALDGDHQWRESSPRDGRRYGEGTFPLWEDCLARRKVFRSLFRDWENGAQTFPDLGEPGQGCNGWTTRNEEPDLAMVALEQGADNSQALLFRTRLGKFELPVPPGRARPAPPGSTPLPIDPRVLLLRLNDVSARRHLAGPADSVSFGFETGGELRGTGVGVYADGRLVRTVTASGAVTLGGLNARELTFRISAPRVAFAGSTAWFARLTHLVTYAHGWETELAAGSEGIDVGSLTVDAAELVTEAGVPVAGAAELRRSFAQPIDRISFTFASSYDPLRLEVVVLADGRQVRILAPNAVPLPVTLTGLAARQIVFRWRSRSSGTLSTPMSASITGFRAQTQTGGTPPTAPPAPPAPGGADLPDAAAPTIAAVTTRVIPRRPARLRVRFRLGEPASVRLRLLRGRRIVVARIVRGRAGANTVVLRLPRRATSGAYALELAARDAAGNVRIVKKRVRVSLPARR